MKINKTPIAGLSIIEHDRWSDSRGYFMETYNRKQLEYNGIQADFVQDNLSFSHRGVIRGLHAQAGDQAQGKLVRVLQGRAWDVAVDIRKGSPTFGQYVGLELSAENQLSFWIPPGFLHGFLSLEDQTLFSYKVTGFYDPSQELGVRWDDPDLAIAWPDSGADLIISQKDQNLPFLQQIESPF